MSKVMGEIKFKIRVTSFEEVNKAIAKVLFGKYSDGSNNSLW